MIVFVIIFCYYCYCYDIIIILNQQYVGEPSSIYLSVSVCAPMNKKYKKLSAQTQAQILKHDQERVRAANCEFFFEIG